MARRDDRKKKLEAVADAHPDAKVADIEKAVAYLSHFGYLAGAILGAAVSPVMAIVNIAAAVTEFQTLAGLPPTGQLDEATKAKMEEPRCGVWDVTRIVEFARWRKNRLTYYIESAVAGLTKGEQSDLIRMAWDQWQVNADIVLNPAASGSTPDIVISTGRGRAQQFDGPSGTLAWAYLPNGSDGQLLMRFDLDETWIKEGTRGILFLNVACHEFGHLLGLEHSRVSSALMAPFYAPLTTKPQPNDDIPRIQALYGPAVAVPIPPTPTPPAGSAFQAVIQCDPATRKVVQV